MKTTDKLAIAKEIIKENYDYGGCGLFHTPNWVGDEMDVLYDENGLEILICYPYSYFEVFGLSKEEFVELDKYYKDLKDLS